MALVITGQGTRAIDCTGSGNSYKEDCANAAHIVKCVNAHDALVQALKDAASSLRYIEAFTDEEASGSVTEHGECIDELVKRLEAAIQQVEA